MTHVHKMYTKCPMTKLMNNYQLFTFWWFKSLYPELINMRAGVHGGWEISPCWEIIPYILCMYVWSVKLCQLSDNRSWGVYPSNLDYNLIMYDISSKTFSIHIVYTLATSWGCFCSLVSSSQGYIFLTVSQKVMIGEIIILVLPLHPPASTDRDILSGYDINFENNQTSLISVSQSINTTRNIHAATSNLTIHIPAKTITEESHSFSSF